MGTAQGPYRLVDTKLHEPMGKRVRKFDRPSAFDYAEYVMAPTIYGSVRWAVAATVIDEDGEVHKAQGCLQVSEGPRKSVCNDLVGDIVAAVLDAIHHAGDRDLGRIHADKDQDRSKTGSPRLAKCLVS